MVRAMCLFTSRLLDKKCIFKIKLSSDNTRNCVIMFTKILYIEKHRDKNAFTSIYYIYLQQHDTSFGEITKKYELCIR